MHIRSKMWKRWWLCYATDFQSLMYPCFICSRIFGIFPYKLNASTFEASKPYYILSSVVIYICCVLNMAMIYNIILSNENFGSLVWNAHIIIYNVLSSFIVIITHFLSSPRMRLLQTILEVSSRLPAKSYQKLSRLIHVKDTLINIVVIGHMCIIFSNVLKFKDDLFIILITLLLMYFTVLVLQIIMLYINCVCILKACFKRINDNLVHMQKSLVSDTKPRVFSLIWHTRRNQFFLVELRSLKKQHLMISNAMQMLNLIFSLQVLVTIVMSFVTITFELYTYAVHWQDGIIINLNIYFIDMFLISMLHNIIKLALIVWACETCKNQAQEIGTTIHDLLNSTNDVKIKYELQLFSLQILHRKNIFSAKGLTVDATLLTAVVGNITTYMLILVQFLIASHSCDE